MRWALSLERIDRALDIARRREAEEQERRERAAAERRFKVEPGLDQQIIHRGGCAKWAGNGSFLDRAEILLAITMRSTSGPAPSAGPTPRSGCSTEQSRRTLEIWRGGTGRSREELYVRQTVTFSLTPVFRFFLSSIL
ncbi:hypothetical protein OHO83_34150 [Streptomyces sp. NBC_00569]|uniref:hypothetical protein n=1 Tax=Streptomyces sp. NBC_00569 TaxID=2975780 RepID=UPI002E7FD227|nr:hypothetical protein [Streptomyces sp. NBC_00569]WUB99770.1 hypothetical protein OHO83_34150 [Streptomyces sp. NBC_00569]